MGDRVRVGAWQPAVVARSVEGRWVVATPEVTDGCEGAGVVEALDWDKARVRLDDGRVVLGVSKGRLTRLEDSHGEG